MDAFLTSQMIHSLVQGDFPKFVGYALIFLCLWIEVRGLKKEVKKLTETISKSFAKGETRFDTIEKQAKDFEHRLTLLEHTGGL